MALVDRSAVQVSNQLPEQDKAAGEFDNVDAIVLDDSEEDRLGGIVDYVRSKFQRAKDKRRADEERWTLAYRNFRGVYGPDTQFTSTEQSKVFLKITKTKVLAAYAQVTDVVFAGGRFPIGVDPTPVPEGADSVVSVNLDPQSANKPQEKLSSTVSRPAIIASLKANVQSKVEEAGVTPTVGSMGLPTEAIYTPAQEAARMMEKTIHDQLEECHADKQLRSLILEMCLLGTGVSKGPFSERKEYPKWSKEGNYEPVIKNIPKFSHVSVWNSYPDPDAKNIPDCEYFIERHRKSRSEMRALKKNPTFRAKAIDKAIDWGTNYEPEDWEQIIEDNDTTFDVDRYEVLEYWGLMDRETAEEYADLTVPRDIKDDETFQVNVWTCNDQVLRMIINPFKPHRIPYQAVPYELNPYSFFGVGVAENMEDTQLLMNGFMRMAVDNAAKSGNLMVEVNEDMLTPGQDMEIYPGKIWKRSGGAPGQAIFGTSFPNISQELFMMFDKVRQQADESTGMPSYAHGGTGVTGVGRTASGMSMLMGAAAQNIKTVVRNIDDYLLTPLGRDFFAFNMQFNFKEAYTNGDLEIVARGTESLMRNEVRSQKLMQLLQLGQNPMIAPLLKTDQILREIVTSLDLEADTLVNDPRSAALYALTLQKYQQALGGPQTATGAQGGPPAVSDPTGTGNGNVAPGAAPTPGEAGFTGAGGASGGGAQANAQAAQQGAM